MSSQVNFPERRIVLLGKTGVGKSASANTILGERKFRSEFSFTSVTARCEKHKAEVAGRMVSVVDTPGLFDTSYSSDEIAKELARSVFLSSPGPHALLYVIKLERFTEHDEHAVELIEKIFGEDMRKYMMILFTCGDQLEGENIDDQIKKHKPLSRLVDQCGGGYHVFNNKDQSSRDQVNELMKKIDRMVDKNEGSCYTNEMFEDAQKSGFQKFWEKYKTHFIFGVAILIGAVLGGGVGAGVVCAVGGSAAAAIFGAGVAGAASGAVAGAVADHLTSKEGSGLGNDTKLIIGSAAAGAAVCGVGRAVTGGPVGAVTGGVGGALWGAELAKTFLKRKLE